MNYEEITHELSEHIALHYEIFDFDLSEMNPEHEDYNMKYYGKVPLENHDLVAQYEYRENESQNWECIRLWVPYDDAPIFLGALNETRRVLNPDLDELNLCAELIDDLHFGEGQFLIVYVAKQGNYMCADFARKKSE